MCLLGRLEEVSRVLIEDTTLVVTGHTEGPDLVLLEAVVDRRCVGIGRVRVKRLTLNIIVVQQLVVIIHWNNGGCADDVLFLGGERLGPLEGVGLIQIEVVDVVLEVRVLFDGLVEPSEGVVEERLGGDAVNNGVVSDMEAIVNLHVFILVVLIVHTRLVYGATETLALAVVVDPPKVIDSLVNSRGVSGACQESGGGNPEDHVLGLQFKHSY